MKSGHEVAYEIFLRNLKEAQGISSIRLKQITGLPFVYIWTEEDVDQWMVEKILKLCAASAMKGKRLSLAMSFVRKTQTYFVYRVRFLVPQRKMFCCGNLCDDCIRFSH